MQPQQPFQQHQSPLSPLSAQQQQQTPPFVGLILSGCPLRTDFVPVDTSQLKFALSVSCPNEIPPPLAAVAEMALFFLPNIPLPPNHGVLCYWQLAFANNNNNNSGTNEHTTTGFELLGALTPQQPSRIFYTGFGEHEQLLPFTTNNHAAVSLTIGLSLEPLDNINNIISSSSTQQEQQRSNNRLNIAQKVGMDLYSFMQSFDTGAAGPNNLVVPNTIFDRWLERFKNRLQRNPNFFLKQQQE